MTPQHRTQKIESYGRAYEMLMAALPAFPEEMWTYKPSLESWSIHEMLVHIADSEANSYIRLRRLVAEPGLPVMAYDENRWAFALKYHEQSPQEALELFKWLRLNSYRLIVTLPESTWANTIYHPENGLMTLDDWLDVYERHIPAHIEQMQAVLQAYSGETS